MEAPRIALRYRDAVPNIDTIDEHQKVLSKFGSVWWGWWKKSFEDGHSDLLSELSRMTAFNVCLVDRTNHKFHIAHVRSVGLPGHPISEEHLIPSYYRGSRNEVFAWFEITSIRTAIYAEDIAALFEDSTIVDLSSMTDTHANEVLRTLEAHGKSSILHLSDLHFGKDYRFRPQDASPNIGGQRHTLSDCIMADLRRRRLDSDVGAILITGDLTTQSNWTGPVRRQIVQEFEVLCQALGISLRDIVALPGNHDVERYPPDSIGNAATLTVQNQVAYDHEVKFRGFLAELTGVDYSAPLNNLVCIKLEHRDLYLCALNSCSIAATNWTEYGYVGELGWQALREMASVPNNERALKIMALHHHLLPIASVEVPNSAGVSLTLDASNILELAQEVGIRFAFHGHQHQAKIARYESLTGPNRDHNTPLYVLANGSTGAKKERIPDSERNTYSVLRFNPDQVDVVMTELKSDATPGYDIFNGPLI